MMRSRLYRHHKLSCRFFLVTLAVNITAGLFAQPLKKSEHAEMLHRAERALTSVIVHDIFSPPVASRIYLYANVAAYESLVPFQDKYKSLFASINGFPKINMNAKLNEVNKEFVCVYAFMKTAQRLVFSEKMLEDSLAAILKSGKKITGPLYKNSIAFAQMIADSVISWANRDNYRETRKLRRYNYSKAEGMWLPTPPGYMAAIEPNWGRIRTIVLDSSQQYKPDRPPVFTKTDTGTFYRYANEVYKTVNSLTTSQRDIALFWDCNPFFLNTQGHLSFATKKLSPGGHWISIAGIAARKRNADLITSAAAYVITSIALFDGFISCWDEKFRSNLIRPETYINAYIDEKWRPLLQTPPFPEYTSGHSVISTAAAIVLTDFFGDNFSFEDNTETYFGLPVRTFSSFMDAANEAAISRLYGGIHYRPAIENGQQQGRQIGNKTIQRIQLH